LSDRTWGLFWGLFSGLLVIALVATVLAITLKLLHAGAQLIPRRTWRRVEARVERAEVVRNHRTLDHVRIHYSFYAERSGAATELCSGSVVDSGDFFPRGDLQARAARYRAVGTIPIWYAEELPDLQYRSRPLAIWQATKGLLVMGGGVMCVVFLIFLVKPAWFGLK